jgi:hypothetical protein
MEKDNRSDTKGDDRSTHIIGTVTNSPSLSGNFHGPVNTTYSGSTTVNQLSELIDIIAELRKIQGRPELPSEKKEELEAEIQTIESQAKSPRPKTQIIKDALSSAKGIIDQAAGVAAAAAPLVARISSWLSGVP